LWWLCEMCEDSNFSDRRIGCCIMTTLSQTSFSPRNFLPKRMSLASNPPYVSLFPWLKIKLKGCHFDTI
jgi:hypothetical protein